MSAPSRRLVTRCTGRVFADKSFYISPLPFRPQLQQQCRAASSDNKSSASKPANPILDRYLQREAEEEAQSPTSANPLAGLQPKSGDLDQGSIFNDDDRAYAQHAPASERKSTFDPEIQAAVLDPAPRARENFERRKIAQMVRRGGRISEKELLQRTEREHLVRSHNMKTSVKKLGMLARQIAGKKLDEAIVQMRFSKKKVAQEILEQLEAARDEAIVMRGMGLGRVKEQKEVEEKQADEMLALEDPDQVAEEHSSLEAANEATRDQVETVEVKKQEAEKPAFKPLDIQLKDGSRYTVTDPTDIYIDQAWVGRGTYGRLIDHRARGRAYMMRPPWTSISVVLKEDKTRLRLWKEREEKRKKQRSGKKVWQALIDRPITNHRPWYNW